MFKLILFAGMLWIANRWASGKMTKQINQLQKFKKRYGIVTFLLVALWYLLIPTGPPDDVLTLWIIERIGLSMHIMLVTALSLYLVWRLRITIVIYKSFGRGTR